MRQPSGSLRLLLLGALLCGCLVLEARAATLILTSEPAGARVFVGGQYVSTTPCSVPIPDTQVGAVAVRFVLEGYAPVSLEIGIAPQREYVLKAALEPGPSGSPLTPASGGGSTTDDTEHPTATRGAGVKKTIEDALRRFHDDCLAYPAILEDLTASSAEALSSRVNGAGERIRGTAFHGPYLDLIPADPATGQPDWEYSAQSGTVESRLTAAPIARLDGWQPLSGAEVSLEAWLEVFQRATGFRPGAGAAPTEPDVAGPTEPAGPDSPGWRPL